MNLTKPSAMWSLQSRVGLAALMCQQPCLASDPGLDATLTIGLSEHTGHMAYLQ